MQLYKLAKEKQTSLRIKKAKLAVVATAVVLVALSLHFDKPIGTPAVIEGLVLRCYEPTGRSASQTHVRCDIQIASGTVLDLWSSRVRPTGSSVSVHQYRRRYTSGVWYNLADEPMHN